MEKKWEDLIAIQIRKAKEEGEFDHLPGRGRPIKLEENPFCPDEVKLSNHLYKQYGMLSPEGQLKKQIEELKERLKACQDNKEALVIKKQIRELTLNYNLRMEAMKKT